MFAGLVFLMWQLHYYSFRTGVAGANFAGDNPTETGMSEQSLAALGGKMASRAWQVMSIAAIVVAAAVAFALTADTLKELSGIWRELELDVEDFFAVLDYGVLAICTIVFLAMCFVKGKYEKGFLAKSEIDCINESFKQKSATEVEALLKKAEQGEEAPGETMKAVPIAKRWIGLGVRINLSLIYYGAMVMAVVFLLKNSFVVSVLAAVLAFGAFVLRNYFMRKLQDETSAVNWQAIVGASAKDMLSAGRAIVKLPFSFSDSKVPQDAKLPSIARKRNRIKYMSFVDPLGIHQFALGQVELGGIQMLFCLLIVGIPISWLWSIFDGIRFSRMSDEEFLVEYHDYCCNNGLMDKVVRLMSKVAIWVAPIAAALVLLAFACALDNRPADGGASVCANNVSQIEYAYVKAKMENKKVESVSDLYELKYLTKKFKCPNGGQYQIEDGRVVCSREEALKAKEAALEARNKEERCVCLKNMEEIESAYRLAKEEGKAVNSLSNLKATLKVLFKDDPEYKDLPDCPSGGKYKLDQYGNVTCSKHRVP